MSSTPRWTSPAHRTRTSRASSRSPRRRATASAVRASPSSTRSCRRRADSLPRRRPVVALVDSPVLDHPWLDPDSEADPFWTDAEPGLMRGTRSATSPRRWSSASPRWARTTPGRRTPGTAPSSPGWCARSRRRPACSACRSCARRASSTTSSCRARSPGWSTLHTRPERPPRARRRRRQPVLRPVPARRQDDP